MNVIPEGRSIPAVAALREIFTALVVTVCVPSVHRTIYKGFSFFAIQRCQHDSEYGLERRLTLFIAI